MIIIEPPDKSRSATTLFLKKMGKKKQQFCGEILKQEIFEHPTILFDHGKTKGQPGFFPSYL